MATRSEALSIDIPVVLKDVKIVFSVPSLSYEGDMAAPFIHTGFILGDTEEWKADLKAIILFHTNAGHPALNDEAYNRDRGIETGNPFSKVITDLMAKGVQVELCGKTAAVHGWVNSDTIPGIRINTDAIARLTQLVQEGYVKISES